MNSNLSTFIQEARDATRAAFNEATKAIGGTVDPDIKLYESLTPQDFENVANKYGIDPVAKWILAVERKKLRGG